MVLAGGEVILNTAAVDHSAFTLGENLLRLVDLDTPVPDVPHLTGLSFEDFVRQSIVLAQNIEGGKKMTTTRITVQLAPLVLILRHKNPPKSWTETLGRMRLFSHFVPLARNCLLGLLAKGPTSAREAFVLEKNPRDPVTPLFYYLRAMSFIAHIAEKHSLRSLFTEIIESDALFVAEMASFLGDGGIKGAFLVLVIKSAFDANAHSCVNE